MIVVTAVSTRAVGTAAEEIFVPAIIVGTIVPTKIVGTAVPTIIVLTAYYWKSCGGRGGNHHPLSEIRDCSGTECPIDLTVANIVLRMFIVYLKGVLEVS